MASQSGVNLPTYSLVLIISKLKTVELLQSSMARPIVKYSIVSISLLWTRPMKMDEWCCCRSRESLKSTILWEFGITAVILSPILQFGANDKTNNVRMKLN